jgi:hypothetical protein
MRLHIGTDPRHAKTLACRFWSGLTGVVQSGQLGTRHLHEYHTLADLPDMALKGNMVDSGLGGLPS